MNILDAIKCNIGDIDSEIKDNILVDMKKLIENNYVSFEKNNKYIKQFLLTLYRSFNIFVKLRRRIDIDIVKINSTQEIIKIIDVNKINIINLETEDFDRIEILTY